MSTRAYKLIEIKTEKAPTFSVSHNWDFVQEYGRFDCEGSGDILQFDREDVERGLKEEKDPENLEMLQDIAKDMGDDDWVEYYCY